jgi:hypothetical protein
VRAACAVARAGLALGRLEGAVVTGVLSFGYRGGRGLGIRPGLGRMPREPGKTP